jgi:RNA polymerase sigma factor for flagellar operon FliA
MKLQSTKKGMSIRITKRLERMLECFSQSKLNEYVTGTKLAELSQYSSFGDLVWVCIANKVHKGDEAWTKVAVETLEALDPNLSKYKETVESRLRVTFSELKDVKLTKWILAEDLLDAGVHLSSKLQNTLFTELSELACRVAEIFHESLTTEQACYFRGLVEELPWLQPLETMLPKNLLPASDAVNVELKPCGGLNVTNKTGSLVDTGQIRGQFHKKRSDSFSNLLIELYRRSAKYVSKWFHHKLPHKVELDDLNRPGIFSLMGTIDTFDPTGSEEFEAHCSPHIEAFILDELQSMDWVPRFVRVRAHQFAKARHLLKTHLGREPTEKEIAEELNIDIEEFNKLRRDPSAVSVVSLNTKYSDSDDEKDARKTNVVKGKSVIKDKKSQDYLTKAQKRDLKKLLTKELTPAEQLIIVLYYHEKMTIEEIGTMLDLSESHVSRMHSSVVARLKARGYC